MNYLSKLLLDGEVEDLIENFPEYRQRDDDEFWLKRELVRPDLEAGPGPLDPRGHQELGAQLSFDKVQGIVFLGGEVGKSNGYQMTRKKHINPL